jgi:hypothetical protein
VASWMALPSLGSATPSWNLAFLLSFTYTWANKQVAAGCSWCHAL